MIARADSLQEIKFLNPRERLKLLIRAEILRKIYGTALCHPFSEISDELLQEIEMEFQKNSSTRAKG